MLFIMNTWIPVIRRLFYKETPKLGRWNIEQCANKTNKKIDFSNEDHCGPCGQYKLSEPPAPIKILVDPNGIATILSVPPVVPSLPNTRSIQQPRDC